MSSGIKIPISLKMVFITVVLILAAVIPISLRSYQLFEETFGKTQEDTNAELAKSKASEIDELILGSVERVRATTNLLLQDFSSETERQRALDETFGRDLTMVSLEVYQLENGVPKAYRHEINKAFFQQYGFDPRSLAALRKTKGLVLADVFAQKSKIHIRNISTPKGVPLFSLGVPFADASGVVHHVAIADFRLNPLQKAFALPGVRTLYLLDEAGVVLAHKSDELALEGRSLATQPIVQLALSLGEQTKKGQKSFRDGTDGEGKVAAFSRTSFGLIVVSEIPRKVILEPAKRVLNESIDRTGYVLSGALFFIIIFSMTLTSPIERLHEATQIVAKGNFDMLARVETRDEVGELARAFNRMVMGLKERDKIKNILTKFHGSTVTDDLLKKDLNLGGTRKNVTVFFSDIRDFTKFSEGHTPEEVVEMLNEYFQIMVGIITSHQGVVDKFVGDAIMAVWGAPQSSGRDNELAVRACLEMRKELAALNDRRLARGHTAIKVGMGVHAGTAISGTIGSTERMEYTVIGDTVNMASRIESSTKSFGADILISESVARDVEPKFVLEVAGTAEVKGKSEPIKMFKVRGTIDGGKTVIVKTAYSDYTPETSEKVKTA